MTADYQPTSSWSGSLQNIRFLATNPCGASPWVYFESGFDAGLESVLELFSFGFSDIAVGFTHPKGRRGALRGGAKDEKRRRIGRDGIKRTMRREGLPEIGNEIGKKIPGSRQVKDALSGGTSHLFWIPFDIAEKALYHYMLAAVAKSGIYEWASVVHTMSCSPEYHPVLPNGSFKAWQMGSWKGTFDCAGTPVFVPEQTHHDSYNTQLWTNGFSGYFASNEPGVIRIAGHVQGEFYSLDYGVKDIYLTCHVFNYDHHSDWYLPSVHRRILCGGFYNGIPGRINWEFVTPICNAVVIEIASTDYAQARGAVCTVSAGVG